jgi:hypothetical protein
MIDFLVTSVVVLVFLTAAAGVALVYILLYQIVKDIFFG